MLEQDLKARKSLCLRCTHIVLPQYIQHGGTHQTHDICSGIKRKRHYRHHIMLPGGQSHRRQDLQLHSKEIQKERADYKARNGNSTGGDHTDQTIQEFSSL